MLPFIKKRPIIPIFVCLYIVYPYFAKAQVITAPQIDALVQRTLTTFDVPGIAMAVGKDGKAILTRMNAETVSFRETQQQ